MKRRHLEHLAAAAIAAASATSACSAVLGLDPPKLDPCATTPCADAGDAASPPDGQAEAGATDSAPDRGPVTGVRCGGGAFGEIGCMGATPVCCQISDAGATTYACRSSAASCEGYAIACASNGDCPGNDVCCHYQSAIKCEPQAACPNSSLLCDPDGSADQCPSGWKCTATFEDAGVPAPYHGCAP